MLALLLAGEQVHAAQHLVRPGDSWSDLGSRLRPGDEIILMPGRHQSVSFDNVRGTRERPITIRGLTVDQPSIIDARQYGIRLRRPEHVVIRDLAITGATIAGILITQEITIDDQPRNGARFQPPPPAEPEPPWPAHVTVRNITVEKTGPHGRRNAIHLERVRHVLIERVRIEGWGGSAVKVAGSMDVRIEHSIMRGIEDHGQLSGVQIHGGSENVRITRCFITGAGEAAIVLGQAPPVSADAAGNQPSCEARRVLVERNLIRRGESAVAFLCARQCVVRNNTILDPQRFAYFVAPPGELHNTTFGANIIVWKPGALESLAHLQAPAMAGGLTVEPNLWWADETQAGLAKLGQPLGGVVAQQVMDVDPDFDRQFKPRNRRAQMFGTEGP